MNNHQFVTLPELSDLWERQQDMLHRLRDARDRAALARRAEARALRDYEDARVRYQSATQASAPPIDHS